MQEEDPAQEEKKDQAKMQENPKETNSETPSKKRTTRKTKDTAVHSNDILEKSPSNSTRKAAIPRVSDSEIHQTLSGNDKIKAILAADSGSVADSSRNLSRDAESECNKSQEAKQSATSPRKTRKTIGSPRCSSQAEKSPIAKDVAGQQDSDISAIGERRSSRKRKMNPDVEAFLKGKAIKLEPADISEELHIEHIVYETPKTETRTAMKPLKPPKTKTPKIMDSPSETPVLPTIKRPEFETPCQSSMEESSETLSITDKSGESVTHSEIETSNPESQVSETIVFENTHGSDNTIAVQAEEKASEEMVVVLNLDENVHLENRDENSLYMLSEAALEAGVLIQEGPSNEAVNESTENQDPTEGQPKPSLRRILETEDKFNITQKSSVLNSQTETYEIRVVQQDECDPVVENVNTGPEIQSYQQTTEVPGSSQFTTVTVISSPSRFTENSDNIVQSETIPIPPKVPQTIQNPMPVQAMSQISGSTHDRVSKTKPPSFSEEPSIESDPKFEVTVDKLNGSIQLSMSLETSIKRERSPERLAIPETEVLSPGQEEYRDDTRTIHSCPACDREYLSVVKFHKHLMATTCFNTLRQGKCKADQEIQEMVDRARHVTSEECPACGKNMSSIEVCIYCFFLKDELPKRLFHKWFNILFVC